MSGRNLSAANVAMHHGFQGSWSGDLAILMYLAVATVVLHVLTGCQYGFQRDELAHWKTRAI
jgi:hypothetical protein